MFVHQLVESAFKIDAEYVLFVVTASVIIDGRVYMVKGFFRDPFRTAAVIEKFFKLGVPLGKGNAVINAYRCFCKLIAGEICFD
jgi:hypothetical protein